MYKAAAVCLVVAVLFCGCGTDEIQQEPVPTAVEMPEAKVQKKEWKPQKMVRQLNRVSAAGGIVAVLQRENSLLCIQSGKGKSTIYRWDSGNGDRTKKELACSLPGGGDVQFTEGYVVFYDEQEKAIVLDQEFNIIDKITIRNKMADGLDRNYCVLPGEKKIVYAKTVLKKGSWYQAVNECDYNGKDKRQICRIECDQSKNVGKVNEIIKLAVSEDEKTLFYSGLYFKTTDENEISSPCFGGISRDTGEVVSVQEEKYPSHLLGNKMIFVDGLKEKGVSSSGYISCIDGNGAQEKYSFRKKEESQEVIVSDGENYYLGYEKMDQGTTRVSCYSFEKGAYQWERKIPEYVLGIWYFEQAKMLLYTYYDEERKICFKKEDIGE